jgi:hypothetical protein
LPKNPRRFSVGRGRSRRPPENGVTMTKKKEYRSLGHKIWETKERETVSPVPKSTETEETTELTLKHRFSAEGSAKKRDKKSVLWQE